MEMESSTKKRSRGPGAAGGAGGGGLYFFGFIGALVYYIVHATSFLAGVIGVLKAIVWPAFLVYELAAFLKM